MGSRKLPPGGGVKTPDRRVPRRRLHPPTHLNSGCLNGPFFSLPCSKIVTALLCWHSRSKLAPRPCSGCRLCRGVGPPQTGPGESKTKPSFPPLARKPDMQMLHSIEIEILTKGLTTDLGWFPDRGLPAPAPPHLHPQLLTLPAPCQRPPCRQPPPKPR